MQNEYFYAKRKICGIYNGILIAGIIHLYYLSGYKLLVLSGIKHA